MEINLVIQGIFFCKNKLSEITNKNYNNKMRIYVKYECQIICYQSEDPFIRVHL